MTKNISQIYEEYKIMPNLQEHMLRVAGVASLICDNFNEPLPKEEIISACLLHDMGNIIKFELEYFPEFLEPEGLEYWKNVQNEFKQKYGDEQHGATAKIVKELNLPEKFADMADQVRFVYLCRHRDAEDMTIKIVHYADGRVGPHGVLPYEERMGEAKERYQGRVSLLAQEEERAKLVACGKEIEKQIFAKCKIKPEDITDEAIKPLISELKNFVIK